MSQSYAQVADDALRLPQNEQLKLVRALLENTEALGDVGSTAAWEDEIESRIRSVDAGRAKGRSLADVLRDVDARLGR